jgi:hypothetical protein
VIIYVNQNKNIMKKDTSIPTDLNFVTEMNIDLLSFQFDEKYSQNTPVTALQKYFLRNKYISADHLTRDETFNLYMINESSLVKVYRCLEMEAVKMGIVVEYVAMSVFSEDDHYENNENQDTKHAETARSDGKNLLLEVDLKKAGGIQGRMYDLLHLAFGHMVQWSTEDPHMLLTKEQAWSIGYRNHEKSPDIVLDMMSLYEFEAGMLAIEVLRKILMKDRDIPHEEKYSIWQYFVDYVYADRGYIIQHYRGNHESFQKFWKFGQPIPLPQEFPHVECFIQRHAVEVGLIKDQQKTN